VPRPKDGGEHDGPQEGRAWIGNADIEMEEVGHTGAEDGDGVGQEPVGERPAPSSPELQRQPDELAAVALNRSSNLDYGYDGSGELQVP
jgi:hypothetical protein